jgi:hypothetical protein
MPRPKHRGFGMKGTARSWVYQWKFLQADRAKCYRRMQLEQKLRELKAYMIEAWEPKR